MDRRSTAADETRHTTRFRRENPRSRQEIPFGLLIRSSVFDEGRDVMLHWASGQFACSGGPNSTNGILEPLISPGEGVEMSSNSEALALPGSEQMKQQRIGKYELEKQLGSGGMGAVYLAKDTQLKRLVALKVLPPDKADNPTLVKRFQAEAQAAAQLRHDNIVSIYENGEADGYLYIAMEYVEGYDAQELIRKRGKIPVKRSIEIIKQVAQALQHADIHKIIHRDIKPSNLLIRNDGIVKLVDLGLARSIDDTLETNITRAGTTVGTVDYMSPEQARNSRLADTRSDLYSLGCTWYHMLTGQPPYPHGSMTNKLQAHASAPVVNPARLNDTVPEALVAVIQRLMAKRPEDRYQTPAELLADLEKPSLLQGGMVTELISEVAEEEDREQSTARENRPDEPATVRSKGAEPAKGNRTRSNEPHRLLPPKKKPVDPASESEDEGSGLDWETLQPFVWGIGILAAIAGLGLLVASFSGNFGADSLHYARPNSAAESVTPEAPTVISPPEGAALATESSAPAEPAADSPADQEASSAEPAAKGEPAKVVKVPSALRSFDAETVPSWVGPAGGSSVRGSDAPPDFSVLSGNSAGASGWHQVVGDKLPAQGGATALIDLSQSLRAIPLSGGTLQLAGTGPFRLPLVHLEKNQHLKIMPAADQTPVIMLTPRPGESGAGLSLSQGVLELERLHFVVDRAALSGGAAAPMIEVIDGQLKVRACTFSVWGESGPAVTAFHFSSRDEFQGRQSRLEPRVLLDQVLVRGEQVTALAIARLTADVVVRNSLLASGTGPVVAVAGNLPAKLPSAAAAQSHRAIRFLESTVFSRQLVLRAEGAGTAAPSVTTFSFQDSVCATTPKSAASCLLEAVDWPLTEPAAPSTRKPVSLDWEMKNSLILGLGTLAKFNNQLALTAADGPAWQELWSKPPLLDQISSTVWPANLTGHLADLSLATMDRNQLISLNLLRADDPEPPGCLVSQLLNPSKVASRRRLAALGDKPVWPAASKPQAASHVVQIDVTKQDLGIELKNGNWPAGTVIEVTGAGLRPTTPVELIGKSWRIVGRPQEAQSLVLTPRTTGPELPGLLTIRSGSLEVENLRFQLAPSQKVTVRSLFAAQQASLTLKGISAQGVLSNDRGLESLVQWDAGESTTDAPPRLSCSDSFLIGSGSLFRIRTGAGLIRLTNSLFVAHGDVLDLQFTPPREGVPRGALIANQVTFSATRSAFHLQPADFPQPSVPVRFYIERCVFAPPVPLKEQPDFSTLVSRAGSPADLQLIQWWGTANGVAPEIASFLRADNETAVTEKLNGLAAWQSTWGEDQDLRLLTTPQGVVLDQPVPNKASGLRPLQFLLRANSSAAKWADDGGPIGADVRQLDPLGPVDKPKDSGKPKKGIVTPDF